MQTLLAAVAVGASLLGLVYTVLLTRDRPRPNPSAALRSAGLTSAFVVAVLALLTIPGSPPWTAGLPTLGIGFAIGGALGLWALLYLPTHWEEDEGTARAVGVLSAAALGPAFLLVVLGGYPTESLTGCILGGAAVALVACARVRSAEDGDDEALAACRQVEIYALATAAVAAGSRLAIERYPRSPADALAGGYWAVPSLMAAVAALALMVVAGGWSKRLGDLRWWVHSAVSVVAAVAAVALLGLRLPGLTWIAPLAGAAFALIVAAMPVNGYRDRPVALAFGAALMALALSVLLFREAQGYGLALGALAAVVVVSVPYLGRHAGEARVSDALGLGLAAIVVLMTLQRVFLERTGRSIVLDYQEFYSLTAAFVGASAGFAVMAYATRAATARRAVLAGCLSVAVPLVVAVVWATRATAAFVGGMVLAEAAWMMMSAAVLRDSRRMVAASAPLPFILGAAAVAAQMAPPLLDLDVSRGVRVTVVAMLALVLLAWILLDGLFAPTGAEE
jgi:hypothetical protein